MISINYDLEVKMISPNNYEVGDDLHDCLRQINSTKIPLYHDYSDRNVINITKYIIN